MKPDSTREGFEGKQISVDIVRVPLAEISSRLAEIEDAKTLTGLLLFLRER